MGDETNVWAEDKPTPTGYVIYGFLIPFFAIFGAIANCINGIVFMRPKMTPSAFVYLAAMSWMDCLSCLLLIFSALAQSLFLNHTYWLIYDIQFQIPLIGVTTGAANLILVSVTYDRMVYVKNVLAKQAPKFCCRKVAKIMILCIFVFVFLMNIPYFFVFEKNDEGEYVPSPFYHSRYYTVHNWLNFIVLGLFPAVFLMIANTIMLVAIRKWCQSQCICSMANNAYEKKRYYYQIRLTATIIAVTFVFFIGDLPQHLLSRRSAIVLLFNGDMSYAESTPLETVRMVSAMLNVLQLSFNILIYATLNPAFLSELFECLRIVSDRCFSATGINFLIRNFKSKRKSRLSFCHNDGERVSRQRQISCVNVCDKEPCTTSKVRGNINETTSQQDPEGYEIREVYTIEGTQKYHRRHQRMQSCEDVVIANPLKGSSLKEFRESENASLPSQLNVRDL